MVGIERPDPMLTEAASRANFTNEAGAFGTICFLKNVMGLWLLESCRREWAASGRACELADLLARAAAVPGFVGFVMPDAPRFFNPASMTREIAEALRATGQEAVDDPVLATKVILDSLALRYASVLETVERVTGSPVRGVHVVGGGSLNHALNQATADATNRPVLAGPAEATAIGNILVQAIALGALPSLSHGRALVRRAQPPRRFEPREPQMWEEARRRYRTLKGPTP